jgi:hypothetical protein
MIFRFDIFGFLQKYLGNTNNLLFFPIIRPDFI